MPTKNKKQRSNRTTTTRRKASGGTAKKTTKKAAKKKVVKRASRASKRKILYPKRRYEVGVMVGAAKAKKLMENNDPDNRGISWTHVDTLVKKMKAGIWNANGEVIKINKFGVVVDGQHRLLAIMRSGITVEFDICYGLSEEAVYTMDEGRKRQLRDKLSREFPDLKKNNSYKEIALIYTKVIDYDATTESGYEAWGRRNRGTWNYPEVFKWVRKHKKDLEFVVSECKRLEAKVFMRPVSVMGALYFLCYRENPDAAIDFFTAMIEGIGYAKGREDPAYWCRKEIERLHARRDKDRGSDPSKWPYLSAVCRAFNAYLQDKPMHSLKEFTVSKSQPFKKIGA